MPTDAKHTAREDVGGSADDSHTGQCSDEELHPAVGHVHFHQHRGQQEHQKDHKERRQDPNIRRQPINSDNTQIKDYPRVVSKISW